MVTLRTKFLPFFIIILLSSDQTWEINFFYSKYISKSYKYILTNKKEEDKYHVLQGKSNHFFFAYFHLCVSTNIP